MMKNNFRKYYYLLYANHRLVNKQNNRKSNIRIMTSLGSSTINNGGSNCARQQSIYEFCQSLSSKQPTPGGGAAAAISAAIGASTASMSGAYTQRRKDEESGAADAARTMITDMDIASLLKAADEDSEAYKSLQSTWKKDSGLNADEVEEIKVNALRVPTVLVEACHQRIMTIEKFVPQCNPQILSDARVGIHLLAGAARSAYQTVLVNSPTDEEKKRLLELLKEVQVIENHLIGIE